MRNSGLITMHMKELDRLKTVQAVVDGLMKPTQAAERLGVTPRHFRRIIARYQSEGPVGLASKHRGRPSNHQLAPERIDAVNRIIRENYADFGPTLAREKLFEVHGIRLAVETVRKAMIGNGLWVPKRNRPPKIYQPRYRRECFGELIQIDGSDHRWFEERGPACTLLVYVDDATSRIQTLYFTKSESTFSYFEATRAYLERFGKPVAFYSDKASVFRVNKRQANAGDGHTQFGRALFELNIEGICANSSQAKGRVERVHQTLQDRLVKELRLRGISDMGSANEFATEFIDDYNHRFSKPPKNQHDAHRPVRNDEKLDLIFAWREPRCVSKSLTIQYDKVMYLLNDDSATRKLIGRYIDVYHYPDGRIEPRADGKPIDFVCYDRLSEINHGAVVDNKRLGHVLEVAQALQNNRDNRRSMSVPSSINLEPRRRGRPPGKKSFTQLSSKDLNDAIRSTAVVK